MLQRSVEDYAAVQTDLPALIIEGDMDPITRTHYEDIHVDTTLFGFAIATAAKPQDQTADR